MVDVIPEDMDQGLVTSRDRNVTTSAGWIFIRQTIDMHIINGDQSKDVFNVVLLKCRLEQRVVATTNDVVKNMVESLLGILAGKHHG